MFKEKTKYCADCTNKITLIVSKQRMTFARFVSDSVSMLINGYVCEHFVIIENIQMHCSLLNVYGIRSSEKEEIFEEEKIKLINLLVSVELQKLMR